MKMKNMREFLIRGAWCAAQQAGHLLAFSIGPYNDGRQSELLLVLQFWHLEISKSLDLLEGLIPHAPYRRSALRAEFSMQKPSLIHSVSTSKETKVRRGIRPPKPKDLISTDHFLKISRIIIDSPVSYGAGAGDSRIESLMAMRESALRDPDAREQLAK